jgi:hypothetical protein
MIIKHTLQSSVNETDTDKLPDVEAMILEKCEELRELCRNSRRDAIFLTDTKGWRNGNCHVFYNISVKDENNLHEEVDKGIINILNIMNTFVKTITSGKYAISSQNKESV